MRALRAMIFAIVLAGGCGDGGSPAEDAGSDGGDASADAGDASTDAGADPIDGAVASGCSAEDVAACAYEPLFRTERGREITQEITYTDVTGLERTFEVQLRLPDGAARPVPVIVWSHGGASGMGRAGGVGTEWSAQLVRAGYAFVAIAHRGRTPTEYEALCSTLGFDECSTPCSTDADCGADEEATCLAGSCRTWKHLSWDRPHDLARTIDLLEEATAPGGPLEGELDLSRLVYAGHSAGAGSTLMVAGATRDMPEGTPVLLVDPRPIAFISASPQGPGTDGFTEDSFVGDTCRAAADDPSLCLTRPHLYMTGEGDDTGDTVSEVRRLSFELAPATGDRHLAFIVEPAARHTTFEGSTDACQRFAIDESLDPAVYPERCTTYLVWLRSVALAFLDAVTHDSSEARAWLSSDDAEILGEGAMTFEHR